MRAVEIMSLILVMICLIPNVDHAEEPVSGVGKGTRFAFQIFVGSVTRVFGLLALCVIAFLVYKCVVNRRKQPQPAADAPAVGN